MNEVVTKPKTYRKITPELIQRFQAEEMIQGNGKAAVDVLEPGVYPRPKNRAFKIRAKGNKELGSDIVPKRVQQIAIGAIERVEAIVYSTDEHVALKASMFVIDHAIGKAVQRNENHNVNLNIESVLE